MRQLASRALTVMALSAVTMSGATSALANGVGENPAWQFDTASDRAIKATIADIVARKKGGYYEGFNPVSNYNTYIYRQLNCSVSSSSTGNTGLTTANASTSSPILNNSSSTSSSSNANSAANGLPGSGWNGLMLASAGEIGASGVLNNEQSSSGVLNSGVSGSQSNSTSGPVSAGGGQSSQVVNSEQNTEGVVSSTISGATACDGVQ